MTDTKDWKINISLLKAYKKSTWTEDFFSETIDKNYGIYQYNIDEWRMMSYYCFIAIYSNKDNVIPLINSSNISFWYNKDNTFEYVPLSDCLMFNVSAYKENSNKLDFPFLAIKPTENIFAFIEWDSTSIYYGFEEIEKDNLQVKETHPKELSRLSIPKRTNEIIDLTLLTWFDLKDFDNALDKYFGN